MAKSDWPKVLMVFFMVTTIVTPIGGLNPRKLDDTTTMPTTPESGIKCGCSSCNPCYLSPPPPPPIVYSSPPPPKKPPTPSTNCPPPPSTQNSPYIYITTPPGNLYPIDQYFSGSGRSIAAGWPVFIVCGFVGLIALW